MKFMRLVALVLVLCLAAPLAFAEEKTENNTVLGWIEEKVDSVTTWASDKWKDASPWIEKTWGDASEWVERTWSDASSWAADLWGDVSSWASEKYNAAVDQAGIWWAETYKKVTDVKDNAWEWIQTESTELKDQVVRKYEEVEKAAEKGVAEAEKKVEELYSDLLAKLNISKEDVSRIIQTIGAYAVQKGIPALALKKVLLPYLVKLVFDSQASGGIAIPAIAVAQYLLGVIEKKNLNTEEQALKLFDLLGGFLKKD